MSLDVFSFKVYFLFYVYLPICTYVHHMCAEPQRLEEGAESPGTELQMFVSCHVGVGPSARVPNALNHRTLSNPFPVALICISLMASEVKHLLYVYWLFVFHFFFFLRNGSLLHLLIGSFDFC